MSLNPSPPFLKPFVLIGLPKSGKTTLVKLLSDQKNLNFADLDHYLETKYQTKVRSLFNEYGESVFRKKELEAFQELLLQNPHLISLGGGAPIKKNPPCYTTIWIRIPKEVLKERIDFTAPYLRGVDFEIWLTEREKGYASNAQITVELTGIDRKMDTDTLWEAMQSAGCTL